MTTINPQMATITGPKLNNFGVNDTEKFSIFQINTNKQTSYRSQTRTGTAIYLIPESKGVTKKVVIKNNGEFVSSAKDVITNKIVSIKKGCEANGTEFEYKSIGKIAQKMAKGFKKFLTAVMPESFNDAFNVSIKKGKWVKMLPR